MVTAGMTPRDAVRQLEARLTAAGCPDADYDAAELFRLVTGRDVRLADAPLTEAQAAQLESLCLRREAREPLQYLCGRWSFLDFELIVGPGVLCPRADTEVVAEAAAQTLAGVKAPRVLDLCAGTGCLGLGVKRFCPDAQATCVEKSPEAFRYLEQNVRTALPGAAPAVQAVQGDLFTYWQSLPEGQLDLIVSNPPYLTAEEMQHLQPEVAQEPAMALEAGDDGLPAGPAPRRGTGAGDRLAAAAGRHGAAGREWLGRHRMPQGLRRQRPLHHCPPAKIIEK